jgi:CheY-like chemotaxis protein
MEGVSPRRPPSKPALQVRQAKGTSHADGRPLRRALLVGPDAVILACRTTLEGADFAVDQEDSGMGAVMSARAARPDLIVIDQQLRDVTGDEAIRWLRSNPELAATPIIVLTAGAADDKTAAACAHCSALRKPFSPDAMRRAIRDALA